MSTVDKMLRRYLESAVEFERAGCEATEDRDKFPLWERAALAAMCAYLLSNYAAGTNVLTVAEDLESADLDGQWLSSWVHAHFNPIPPALPASVQNEESEAR